MLLAALDVATDSGPVAPSPQAVKATVARDVAAQARRSAERFIVTRATASVVPGVLARFPGAFRVVRAMPSLATLATPRGETRAAAGAVGFLCRSRRRRWLAPRRDVQQREHDRGDERPGDLQGRVQDVETQSAVERQRARPDVAQGERERAVEHVHLPAVLRLEETVLHVDR